MPKPFIQLSGLSYVLCRSPMSSVNKVSVSSWKDKKRLQGRVRLQNANILHTVFSGTMDEANPVCPPPATSHQLPAWASLFKGVLDNDGYTGYVNTLEEAEEVVRQYERSTGTQKFTITKKTAQFGRNDGESQIDYVYYNQWYIQRGVK